MHFQNIVDSNNGKLIGVRKEYKQGNYKEVTVSRQEMLNAVGG